MDSKDIFVATCMIGFIGLLLIGFAFVNDSYAREKTELCQDNHMQYNDNMDSPACLLKIDSNHIEKFCIETYKGKFKLNEHPTSGDC